jgi:hypothetical protein
VKGNLQVRKEAVVQAEQMIAEQSRHLRWLEGRNVVPLPLSAHHDALRESGSSARGDARWRRDCGCRHRRPRAASQQARTRRWRHSMRPVTPSAPS